MASSMLAADKRWTSTRKSGMTVLGKIPKPINSPSQRGTLTGGCRPPATSSAWNSSILLSPEADRSVGCPGQINDRPSSAGSTTRPSTAGSDRSNDSPSAWGSNSRPSTASGLWASNSTSLATSRPQSAETRPGSSQLSRFAECSVEKITVHGATRVVEESGPMSSKTNEFTLSSGDFPSLGSGKNSESSRDRGHSSQGNPSSGSGRDVASKEHGKALGDDGNIVVTSSPQNINNMKTDDYSYNGGSSLCATNIQREPRQPQPYPSLTMAPHHIDSWRPLPLSPEGIWYRGGGPGGPYRFSGPSGNIAVDPYMYYPPFQPNSEAAARPGTGRGTYHPKNAEGFNPHLAAHPFMVHHPIIPVMPGVYAGPVPYDGCYGPQQPNLCNAGGQEVPSIGMPSQPGLLNQYTNQTDKLNPGQFQARPNKHNAILPLEQVESDRAHGAWQNQCGAVLQQQDGWEDTTEPERKGQPASVRLPYSGTNMPGVLKRLAPVQRTYQAANDAEGQSPDGFIKKLQTDCKEFDDGILLRRHKSDNSVARDQHPVIKKNVPLIEKIDGLNNKVHSSSSRESLGKMPGDGTAILGLSEPQHSTVDKPENLGETTHSHPNRRVNAWRNRPDCTSKSSPNSLASDVWTEHSVSDQESLNATNARDHLDIGILNSPPSHGNASDESNVAITNETCFSSLDPVDYSAQRAKMKEMATQRAKQLQQEEEERTREQKAKALAKLEDLNRRSSGKSMTKSSDALPLVDDVWHKPLACTSHENPNASAQANESAADNAIASSELSSDIDSFSHKALNELPVIHQCPSSSEIEQEASSRVSIASKASPHSHDGSDSKHKPVGYRRRHNITQEKILVEKSIGNLKNAGDTNIDTPNCSSVAHEDPFMQHKKSSRNSRHKKKTDEAPVSSALPSSLMNQEKVVIGSQSALIPTQSSIEVMGCQALQNVSVTSSGHVSSKAATEETQGKTSNHPKSQLPRSSARNLQGTKTAGKLHGNETVIWAPVRQSTKNEHSEAGKHTDDNDPDNVIRAKRAEMERYVPKPLCKELLLLNSGEASLSLGPVASVDVSRNHTDDLSSEKGILNKSSVEKMESSPDTRKWDVREDNKPVKKQGKMHASWRKRNSSEPVVALCSSTANSVSSDAIVSDQKPPGQLQPLELDRLPENQFKSGEWNSNDNNVIPSEFMTLPPAVHEQQVTSRRRRQQQFKVHRPLKNNYWSGTDDNSPILPSAVDPTNQSEQRAVSSSEIKNSGQAHLRSHWKPKSHVHPQNYLQGSGGDEREGKTIDHSSPGVQVPLHSDDRSDPAKKKSVISKGDEKYVSDNCIVQSYGVENSGDKSYMEKLDASPAPRRQGQHNGWHGKGRETMYRGKDVGKQNLSTNNESRTARGHVQYKPVGSHNKPTGSFDNNLNVEQQLGEGHPMSVSRHWERDQRTARHNSRFIRQSSGTEAGNRHGGE